MIFDSIAIASDHRGYWLKHDLMEYFGQFGYEFEDFGTENDCVSVDYPDYAKKVTDYVLSKPRSFGILICHSGVGMSIAANRVKSIRAVLCNEEEIARLSRLHNNANVICFGAGFIYNETAIRCLNTFMRTEFDERHQVRLCKIDGE